MLVKVPTPPGSLWEINQAVTLDALGNLHPFVAISLAWQGVIMQKMPDRSVAVMFSTVGIEHE